MLRQIQAAWRVGSQSWVSRSAQAIALTSLLITAILTGAKSLGWLQPLELRAYDWMMRFQIDEGADPRLLVVTITEADLGFLQRPTPSDLTLAQALETIEQAQPRVIGLDLYRDLSQPPGNPELLTQLQSPNIVAITKISDTDATRIPPPPGVSEEQIGFNDLPVDPDRVIRRGLLFASVENERETQVFYSFALRVALRYLAAEGIVPAGSPQNPEYMQLGETVFVPLEETSGGYQQADAGGYQVLMHYRSPRPIARTVSLTQVLQGEVNPSWIADKIVLIGTTAPSGKDLFYTPYSAGQEADHQMPGVEIHGQMVSQIISAALDERSLFRFWPEWVELIWVWAWAIASGTVALLVRAPIKLVLSETGLWTALLGVSFGLFSASVWVPVAAPLVGVVLAAGLLVVYRAYQSQQQQQMVMTLLGQNTSPEIATALWKSRDRLLHGGKLPGQQLTATMLFTDIKNFSTLAEQMSPELLLDWLNEYLESMTQAVQHYHGIVNKFTGDGILAVFGVPMPRTSAAEIAEDAYHAVACALDMSDRLHQLNQTWQERGLPVTQMRVGIFTGPLVAGSLGGKDRLEYGLIGDSVNIAARLESCEKERQEDDCRILMAQETLAYVEDRFQVEPWGPMALKGKQQLIEVYRVMAHASSQSLAPADQSTPQPT